MCSPISDNEYSTSAQSYILLWSLKGGMKANRSLGKTCVLSACKQPNKVWKVFPGNCK